VYVVSGSQLATARLATTPIMVSGWTKRHTVLAQIEVPAGVTLNRTQVTVTIEVSPIPGSAVSMAQVLVGGQRHGTTVTLDQPLAYEHLGTGITRSEVANLSRNVVIESAQPDGVRGHTLYHRDSRGGISYAEFRHLGKEGVLGKYSIHFHLGHGEWPGGEGRDHPRRSGRLGNCAGHPAGPQALRPRVGQSRQSGEDRPPDGDERSVR